MKHAVQHHPDYFFAPGTIASCRSRGHACRRRMARTLLLVVAAYAALCVLITPIVFVLMLGVL